MKNSTRNEIDLELQGKLSELSKQMLDILKEAGIKEMFNLGIDPKDDYISFFSFKNIREEDEDVRVYFLDYGQWIDENGNVYMRNGKYDGD